MSEIINQSIETVPVSALTCHNRNVNMGDIGAIYESIEANGFYGTIVAQRSTGNVLAGNHRLQAAIMAGITEVPVCWVDCDSEQALRILLVDNRSARLGHDDENKLAELLVELSNTEAGLIGTGFSPDDLDQLISDLAGGIDKPEELWKGMPEFEQENADAYQTIKVRFDNVEAAEGFAELIGQTINPETKAIWHPYKPPENLKQFTVGSSQLPLRQA